MALSKEDRAEVESITKPIADSVAKLTETIGTLPTADKVGEAIKAQVEAATKPITEAITKLGEAKPGDDKNKDGKKGEDAEPPQWGKDLAASVKSLADSVAPVLTDRQKNQQSDAARALVTKTLTDLKLTGLLKKSSLVERLIKANPTDADAVKAALEAEKKHAIEMGVDVKAFSASAAGEGGKSDAGGGDKQDSEAVAAEILARKNTSL